MPINPPPITTAYRPARHPARPGAARAAGVAVLAGTLLLGGGLFFVVRSALQPPASSSAAPAGSTATGVLDPRRLAQTALDTGDYEAAAAHLAPLLAAAGADADFDLLTLHTETLLGQGRFEEAYAAMTRAIVVGPKGPRGVQGTPPLHFQAGTIASRAGLPDRAIEHYGMAQAGDPTEPRYPLFLGMVQLRVGETNAGLASLLRAVHLKPDLPEAWGTMAEVYLRDNSPGLALQHIAKARELQPDMLRWRLVEARALKRRGEPEAAAAVLVALSRDQRHRPEVLTLLTECYGMLSRPADAARLYMEAAEDNRTDPALAYQAALWAQRAGDTDTARRFATRAQMLGSDEARQLLATLN